jgi:hypothetical protein
MDNFVCGGVTKTRQVRDQSRRGDTRSRREELEMRYQGRNATASERELHGIPCVVYAAKSTEDRRGSIPEQLRELCSRKFVVADHEVALAVGRSGFTYPVYDLYVDARELKRGLASDAIAHEP